MWTSFFLAVFGRGRNVNPVPGTRQLFPASLNIPTTRKHSRQHKLFPSRSLRSPLLEHEARVGRLYWCKYIYIFWFFGDGIEIYWNAATKKRKEISGDNSTLGRIKFETTSHGCMEFFNRRGEGKFLVRPFRVSRLRKFPMCPPSLASVTSRSKGVRRGYY